jgi:hypothetical protein
LKPLLVISLLSVLSGCSWFPQPGVVPVYKQSLDLELPEPITLADIKYKVITDSNAESIFVEQVNKSQLPAFVCMTPEDYKSASKNQVEVISYIESLQLIHQKYIDYYEPVK